MKLPKNQICISISLIFAINIWSQDGDSITNMDFKGSPISKKNNYLFVYDGLHDMSGSALSLLSVANLFGRGLDELSCEHDPIADSDYCLDNDNFAGRLFMDVGLNFIFTTWMSTIQHECMGHGFRAREFNARVTKYSFPPATFADAYIVIHYEDLPYYGNLLFETGGSESNMVFSRESFRQNLMNDYFHHYAFYSLALKVDLALYILGTPDVNSGDWKNPLNGSDIANFVKKFRIKSADNEAGILKSAQNGAYWSLADPGLLLSFFNYARDYIVKGRALVSNPMIRIGNLNFLPFTDFHLSPYGYEYYLGSYFKYNRTLYETYYRWSSGNIDGKSYGFGMNISNLYRWKQFRFDAGFDIWKQDFNLLYYESNTEKYKEKIFSGKLYFKTFYQFSNTFSLFGQAGYKGEGFLTGSPVKKGFHAKAGLGIYF